MYIHREGYIHILLASILWVVIATLNYYNFYDIPVLYWAIQVIFFLLWFWVLCFFRIPKRELTKGDDLIVAPADGKIVVIEETFEPEYYKERRLQVSIFMSPLDVHVNRSPITGKVDYVKYHPGKYLVAWHPKSSTENERTTVVISNENVSLLLRQVAGAMARRIKYYVTPGNSIEQDAEFGFIRFGSRVDVFFPIGTKIDVSIGQKVQGGVTVLAQMGKRN